MPRTESPLPTSHDTVFHKAPMLLEHPAVLRLVRGFQPGKSSLDRDIKTVAYDLDESEIAHRLIRDSIEVEANRARPDSQETISRLESLEAALDQPTPYAKVRMRFEQHAITDPAAYEGAVGRFTGEAKKIFVKNEENFVFLEAGETADNYDKLFQAGYRKYRSAVKADIHAGLVMAHYTPDQFTMDRALAANLPLLKQKVGETHDANVEQLLYTQSIYEGIDRLLAEGYRIRVVFEDFKRTSLNRPQATDNAAILREVAPRNRKITKDILSLVGAADLDRKKMNLLLVMGSYHSLLHSLLPANLRAITHASTDEAGGEMMRMLYTLEGFLNNE